MSSQPVRQPAAPVTRPVRPTRPRLTVVARTRVPVRRAPFLALVLTLLAGGLLGLLLLNTVVAQQAFALHRLNGDIAALAPTEQQLQRSVADLQAPAALAARARALGMLPATTMLFIRLPDGAILGPAPAPAPASTRP